MKRTTEPTQTTTPDKAKVVRAIARTTQWLRDNHVIDYPSGEKCVYFEEPLWKGWVLGFHHEDRMFLCTPFRKHKDLVYKLTPAGWAMMVPKTIVKKTLAKRQKLAKQKGYDL